MSTSVDSLYSSSSRITGMFSNLDTDKIVKDLCSGQQSKIDTEYQSKTKYEWQQTDWTDISDAVKEFSQSYCSVLGSTSMLSNSTYVAYNVSTTDTSGAVSLSADAAATANEIKVSVEQTAKNTSVTSPSKISGSTDGSGISSSNTTALGKLTFSTPMKFDVNGNVSFKINSKTFTFSADITLQSMINTINADTDANVTMKYSRLTDSFTLTSDSGGADSRISIQNLSGNAFGTSSAFGIAEGTTKNGRNAKVTINDGTTQTGVALEKDSNSFTLDGITYGLSSATAGREITFSVKRDYSSTVDAISKFVDSLNTLIKKVNTYTTAKDYSDDYPVLTEAQKGDMKTDEIEKWETKAKNGILRHNNTLESLVSNLKNAFFTKAGGTGKNTSSIGISTGSYFGESAGLLEVDSKALKEALASNPEQVVSIFTGGSSTADSDQQGVIYKLRNTISSFSTTSTQTLDKLGDKMDDSDDEMDTLKDKLKDMTTRYYKKFSDMETALSKLNSTSSMITSMFS